MGLKRWRVFRVSGFWLGAFLRTILLPPMKQSFSIHFLAALGRLGRLGTLSCGPFAKQLPQAFCRAPWGKNCRLAWRFALTLGF